jgi:hypothetical protein
MKLKAEGLEEGNPKKGRRGDRERALLDLE